MRASAVTAVQRWRKGASMNGFERLLACAGAWEGRNRVEVTPGEPVEESASRMIVTPVLRDTFVRFDHTWSWKQEPQIGSMLIGFDGKSGAASIHWIDTWHNGTRVMSLTGRFEPDGRLVVRGHFPVSPGPDWGWRIEISANQGRLKVDMFCVTPAGQDEGGAW